MSKWHDIKTAPGMVTVRVKTEQGRKLLAFWDGMAVEGPNGSTGAWVAAVEGKHPPCWSDGICWAENEDLKPSDRPVKWQPAPEAARP